MSAVILKRLARGKSPFHPDKGHLHHRLLKAGLSQRHSVLLIYAMTLWGGSLALALAGLPAGGTYLGGASLLLAGVSWGAWQRHRQRQRSLAAEDTQVQATDSVNSKKD